VAREGLRGETGASLVHPLSRTTVARISAALFAICGLLVIVVTPWLPARSHLGLIVAGLGSIATAGVMMLLPWERWPRGATLWLTGMSSALIALHNYFTGNDGFRYSILFTVVAAWTGLCHPRGTTLALAPLFGVAYVAPMLLQHDGTTEVATVAYGVPLSVLIGETIAWVTARLARTQRELQRSDSAWQGVFDDSPIPMWVYDAESLAFLAVNDAAVEHYGWTAAEFSQMRITDIRPPDTLPALTSELDRRRNEPDRGAVWMHHTKDGTPINVEVHGRPVQAWGPNARLVVAIDVTDRQRAQEALARRTLRDDITGLPNRALLLDRLAQALARSSGAVGVLLIDLDRFRRLNELIGAAAADEVLRAAGQRVRAVVPKEGTVGRWGGDTFLVVVEADDRAGVRALGEAVLTSFAAPFETAERAVEVTVSVGAALSGRGADPGSLMTDAENALGLAKSGGRNRLALLDDHARYRAATRRTVEQQLAEGIRDGQLHLNYQPQLDLRDGSLAAVEALVRWDHPGRGTIPPSEFIPIAEESGAIVALGDWVLDEACRQAAHWERSGGPRRVSINVSAVQVADPSLPSRVLERLALHGLSPDRIRLELTEHALAAPSAAHVLSKLSEEGIGLSLDDFGTGYSSLAYLRRFPIDEIKVDRSFVNGMTTSERDLTIVSSILRLGNEMGLTTVAEGVETAAQAERLAGLGCTLGQGFLYSRAITPDRLERWIAARPGGRPSLRVVPGA
jgi:diguanylate cyclase (GGDEF)-like protein/PAS domain S-box-containing protein